MYVLTMIDIQRILIAIHYIDYVKVESDPISQHIKPIHLTKGITIDSPLQGCRFGYQLSR
jgi:hypothetical protein